MMKTNTTTMTRIRTYSEVIKIPKFEDRFEYLKMQSYVGEQTFGSHRYLNQNFYRSEEWKRIRRDVIVRDNGCDLADPDRPIFGRVLIHHIEPITIDDILARKACVTDLENLICVSYETHNALHYGNLETLPKGFAERKKNDTCPWR